MQFRVATLNLEQDHKRWSDRLPLISAEIAGLRPDVIALNEVCVPLQTARLLRDSATAATRNLHAAHEPLPDLRRWGHVVQRSLRVETSHSSSTKRPTAD